MADVLRAEAAGAAYAARQQAIQRITPTSVSYSSSGASRVSTSSVRSTAVSGGSATPATTGRAPAGIDRNELAQQYGFTLAFMNAYPEVGALFDQAVREGWTAEKFQAKFKNSNWYNQHTESQRKAALLSTSDPAEWGQLWNRTQHHVMTLLGDIGGDAGNWDSINAIATHIIWDGWNDERVRNEIGQYIVFGDGGMARGKAGEIQRELNAYSYAMGVKNADSWVQEAVRRAASGRSSIQDFKNDILNWSIAAFPGYEDQLRSGMTMSDIAQPYTQSMSQILEIAPGEVNLFDPTIRGALGWKDSAGKAMAKPLWQFQNDLRGDERWTKTQNAQDAAMGTAHKVLQDMGIYS